MNFSELEALMSTRGVNTLAEIARTLNTTPQAVSNWKARNQVPHHINAKLSVLTVENRKQYNIGKDIQNQSIISRPEKIISPFDILLILSQQLKVIALATFISVFFVFTYVRFIQPPLYRSWATILLPENKSKNLGGLAGFASQFGVSVPIDNSADLSSPYLFPELLRSRTFAEKILYKKFFTIKYGKELPLVEILIDGSLEQSMGRDALVTKALNSLENMLEFDKDPSSTFSVIIVSAFEPVFAKELADEVLKELENLNRFYKSQTINEKIKFINQRINAVKTELEVSEHSLEKFNEQNRQVSSPSLKLEQDRLARDVEIQKGIFLTLKQQLELAKIDEVQKSSIMQILDSPIVPLAPINKNLKLSLFVAVIFGLTIGMIVALIRGTIQKLNKDKRKKLNKSKRYLKNKVKDFISDRKVLFIVFITLTAGLPYYTGIASFGNLYSSSGIVLYKYIYIFSITLILLLIAYSFKKR